MAAMRIRTWQEKRVWGFLSVLTIATIAYLLIKDADLFVDEHDYVRQIESYRRGVFAHDPGLDTSPSYPMVIWGISSVLRSPTVSDLRLFTCILGLASVAAFYCCATKIDDRVALIRTFDYFLLPILFPYFFLIYTDPFAMLFLLLAVYGYLDKQYSLAGICSGLSVLIRQTHIIWVCMLLTMIYVDTYGFRLSWTALREHGKQCWSFVLVITGFSIFVLMNGGVAIGSPLYHPFLILRTENVFFSLFIFSFLFLPFYLSHLPEIYRLLKHQPLFLLAGLIVASVYLSLFTVDHPYNLSLFFLRNHFLQIFTSNILLKTLLFIPIFLAILSLAVSALGSRSQYLLYPFWLLALLPLWLIETRYYIPLMALFLLFKKPEPPALERRLLMYWGGLSAVVFLIILSRRAFP
jgi:alpha-1,2-glucosyltransferase